MLLEELRALARDGKLHRQFFQLDDSVYRDGPGLSHSDIKEIFEPKTPQNFRAKLGKTREPTDAMKIGSATHLGILQHEEFLKRVRVLPDINRRTKAGKEEYENFHAENADKIILKNDDLERIEGMAEKVLNHPRLSGLINNPHNMIEHCGYLNIDKTLCKFKPDLLNAKLGLIVDIKTTQSGHYHAFRREISDYCYDSQAAFYCHCAKEIFQCDFQFMWLAIEKFPPFDVYLYYPAPRMVSRAMEKVFDALSLIDKCYRENNFPGVAVEAREIDFADWVYRSDYNVFEIGE